MTQDEAKKTLDAGREYAAAASKQYLGDAVYFEFDGFHIWLSTSNGMRDTNRIALDPNVCEWFVKKYSRLQAAIAGLMRGEQHADGTGEIQQGVLDSKDDNGSEGSDLGDLQGSER